MGQENFPKFSNWAIDQISRDYNGLNFVSDLYQILSTTNLNNP